MRNVPAATLSVLQNAPENGIKVRDFVWIETLNGQGYGFYSGIEPAIQLTVVSAQTGNLEIRTYLGAGTLHSVGEITRTVGLDVYNVSVMLSNINPSVQNLVRGGNVRNGIVEIHRGIIDPLTDELADPPIVDFFGTVNKASPRRPAVGGSGGIEISCTSFTNELTRSNPAMLSDATQMQRGGDRFFRYIDTMAEVRVPWGADPQEVSKTPRRKKFLGIF